MKLTIAMLAVVSMGAIAFGQTAQVTGMVTDQSGSAAPGAEVSIMNTETGVKKSATTNELGYYTVPFLNPGNYDVIARKAGFKSIDRKGVKLEVAQIARLDFNLEVGEVVESVTVISEAPLLASESATIGQVIGRKKILDLPLSGRNFTQLATLVPGAISRGTDSSLESPKLSINGLRDSKTTFMIDGGVVTSQYFDGATIVPSVDAIEEFSVQSNAFAAEYGQGAAVINVSLKSGTNVLHGSVYEFLRNQVLDSRNFFDTTGVRPPLKQNQYGFTIGGPVVLPKLYSGRDRTFFFGDYEGTRTRRTSTFTTLVPTAAMRRGDFSALRTAVNDPTATRVDPSAPGGVVRTPFSGNVIPADRFAKQSMFFMPFYPEANSGDSYLYTPGRTNDNDRFDIRIDHRISSAGSLSASYTMQTADTFTPGRFPANGSVALDLRKQRFSLSENHSFSPTVINEVRLGYVRSRFLRSQQGLGTNYTVQSGIGGFEEHSAEFPGFPGLGISGYLGFDVNAFVPIFFRDNKYEVSDNVTLIRGAHTLKTGVTLRRYDTATTNSARSRGDFTFNGNYTGNAFADYLLGIPFQGRRTFPRNLFGIKPIRNEHFFVQDDWKVTSRFTLNLGLRYELNHPVIVLHNQAASTDPILRRIVVASEDDGTINYGGQQVGQYLYPLFADLIVPASQVGLGRNLTRLDRNNFAPRFGMAWRPFGSTFVVRAGYGIFYGLIQGNRLESTGIVNPPFLADELNNFNTSPIPTKTLANMFPPISQGLSLVPLSFFQLDPDARDPYIQQWNLTLQKVVFNAVSIEGAYVANKGTKIEYSRALNIPEPGPGTVQDRRPWTRFAAGSYVENSSGSTYHAFQGKAEIKGWRGLSMLASYAFGKSIDNLSGDVQGAATQDPRNTQLEKGPSDFDVKHRFVWSGNYGLPFGRGGKSILARVVKDWEIGSIITLQSGLPYSPSMNTDTANTGIVGRPDRIGRGTLDNPTLERDFDTAAFKVPALYTYGNASRNMLYRRGTRNWDMVAMRNFRFTERWNLQFRGEFFNFTNTPSFGAPVSNIQAGNVGRITSAGDPRSVQLGLKLSF
ncbi:MAG TPA: TonB-dependent receptor [Bryobacteraceae bacterium]|nr:TonB-dependent receptor [Bryobacteraceae bacterium]